MSLRHLFHYSVSLFLRPLSFLMRKMIRAIRWSRIYPLSRLSRHVSRDFFRSLRHVLLGLSVYCSDFFPQERNTSVTFARDTSCIGFFFFEPPGCRFVYRNSRDRLVMNVPSFVFFVSFFFPSSSFFFFWATMDLACKIIRTNNLHWLDVLFTLYRRFYSWIFCTYNREYFVRIIYL